MTNFTRSNFQTFGIYAFLFLLCLGGSTLLQAQSDYTVSVTAPAGIAGDYDARLATFGVSIPPCSFTGELVAITDGTGGTIACDTITNDLTGKIAVIDRGTCNFSIKVYEAQQKGAIAVLVANNQNSEIFEMGAGTNAELITIPSWMITLSAGNTIKPELMNGVTVTITQDAPDFPMGENVLWGDQPGEGDFGGGLNGWTANTITCAGTPSDEDVFTWSSDGSAPNGSCSDGAIYSPTRCNGAIVVESDFIDNGGNGCGGAAVGTGPCPAPQIAELTSPVITLDAPGQDVNVRFYQHLRQFNTDFFLAWTIDGGATWDTTQINEDVVLDDADFSSVSDIARVPLPGTAGATSLQIKFIVNANYYFWIIDDVQIVQTAANNLRVNPFYAVAPNAVTPLAHADYVGFLADIENLGTATQTNVNLNATVYYRAVATDPFTEVFSTDRAYGSVPAGALIENLPFAMTFTPDAAGQYVAEYTISADSTDAVADNNTQQFQFLIGNETSFGNIFAKDLTGPVSAVRPADSEWEGANEPHTWAWGVCYYVPQAAGNFIQDVSFGMQLPAGDQGAVGNDVIIFVYEWVDANQNELAEPEERTAVGFGSHTITGTESFTSLITLPIIGLDDEPVALKDDTYYLVMAEYFAVDQSNILISFNNEIDYGGMVLLGDSLDMPRYGAFLGINDDLTVEPYSSLGFGYEFVPVMRMTVTGTPTSTKDVQKLESKFGIFPNPTSDVLNVQLNLDNAVKTATVRLFDISGRMLQQWNYDNVQKERFEYKLNNLSSGTYFIQLITEEGAGTKKFIVR